MTVSSTNADVAAALPSGAHRVWFAELARTARELENEAGHFSEGWRSFKTPHGWSASPCNWWAIQIHRDETVSLSIYEGEERIKTEGHYAGRVGKSGAFRGGRFGRSYSERRVVHPDSLDMENDRQALQHAFHLHLRKNCECAPEPVMLRAIERTLRTHGRRYRFQGLNEAKEYCIRAFGERGWHRLNQIAEAEWSLLHAFHEAS